MAQNQRPEYFQEEDKWYKYKGVKPPERHPHITEAEIREILAGNLSDHKCDWKQNGAIIYCDVGDYEHGKKIGTQVRLAGTKPDGLPLLVPVGPILRSEVQSG